jgi:CubicO group peptidase (beta-lactamase class C family)
LLSLVLHPTLIAPQTATAAEVESKIASIVDPFLAENQVPGLSVAVVRDGELLMTSAPLR